MKIIDKTPLQDENGDIGLIPRIQGTLKYGLNWYAELEAQKTVIAQLDRSLEKGFVLIRNFTLPNSEIVIPVILIGAGGIWVIYVTNAKGYFEAKGDQWNTISNGRSQPAKINLLSRTAQLTRVFQKYLEIHKFNLPVNPEPVLIASDPGAQIESMRPAARVVRSDAIRQFAASLLQARPVCCPQARSTTLQTRSLTQACARKYKPPQPNNHPSRARRRFSMHPKRHRTLTPRIWDLPLKMKLSLRLRMPSRRTSANPVQHVRSVGRRPLPQRGSSSA
jgi:hypothetical protein